MLLKMKRLIFYIIRLNVTNIISDDQNTCNGVKIRPLDFNFIPYSKNNRVIYEYFDDPNEIVDRLRLFIKNGRKMEEIFPDTYVADDCGEEYLIVPCDADMFKSNVCF